MIKLMRLHVYTLIALSTLVLVVACGADGSATPNIPVPKINITRQNYEDALAKWQSQGITNYEIEFSTVPHASGTAINSIRRVRGETIEVVDLPSPGVNADLTPRVYKIQDFKDPITHLFEKINHALKFVEEAEPGPYIFEAAFDQELGYPSYYSEVCADHDPTYSRASVCPTDSFTSDAITKLQVVE